MPVIAAKCLYVEVAVVERHELRRAPRTVGEGRLDVHKPAPVVRENSLKHLGEWIR
jgi:hypothetical protein